METEQRLIDANELWSDIMMLPHNGDMISSEEVEKTIMDAHIVDAVEVVHGRWEDVALRFTQVKEKCSVCGGIVYAHGFNYCPNCGAKMDGESK